MEYYGRWVARGAILPGIRFGWSGSLYFFVVGRRPWVRTYRVDVLWNGTAVFERRLRARLRSYSPARRVYDHLDPDEFYMICEGQSDEGYLPVHTDNKGREYCIHPPTIVASFRVLPPPR